MTVAWRRIAAWLIDCACILVWVAVTAAIGVPLYRAGVIPPTSGLALNVIGAVVIVVPVVVAAACCESGPVAATPGKRALGIVVDVRSGQPRFRLALGRNLLKIGLPWLCGHAAVIALVNTGTDSVSAGVWALTIVAYVIPIAWIVSVFIAGGRTPYDRIAGTRVVRADKFADEVAHSYRRKIGH